MQAICVSAARKLELCHIPVPNEMPPGHLLITIEAAAINHEDKSFHVKPSAVGAPITNRSYDIWGASAAGTVRAVGADLPQELIGCRVAIYRSLNQSQYTIGLWSEEALVPRTSCVVLPESVSARDYSGSLVNVITSHAFLEEIAQGGHKGVIVTAGSSATGLAIVALARRRGLPVLLLAGTTDAAAKLRSMGIESVLDTSKYNFLSELGRHSSKLGATAVFDAVGGELTRAVSTQLPMNSTIYLYGFLEVSAPVIISSFVRISKNLVLKRFQNFANSTITDSGALVTALTYLESVIEDSLFRTQIGKEFAFEDIDAALAYKSALGAKAVLVPRNAWA